MSPTRTERRREATKRQIMGILSDDISNSNNNPGRHASTTKPLQFVVPKDLIPTDPHHIRALLEDLQKEVHDRQQLLTAEAQTGKQEQQQAYSCGMLKLSKAVKKMTVRDFNKAHNCNLLELITSRAGKKKRKDLETPAPTRCKAAMATPSRTVKRGEAIFSMNGSPVDTVEEGTLVATVSKKRRGNDKTSAVFDINVGEGRYISLSDPNTVKLLDDSAKESASSQLQVIQDQIAVLMAQLNNKT